MTDDTGMLQHSIFSVPNPREGYTTDDNARALIVSTRLENANEPKCLNLSRRYLAFLWLAFNDDAGRFRNFLSYDRNWLEQVGSEDSHGRALWSIGNCPRAFAGCRIARRGGTTLRVRGSFSNEVYESARMGV